MIEKIRDLRKKLNENPEISNKEYVTREILKDFLKQNSNINIVDMNTYFYAERIIDSNSETIVIRADHDAITNSKGQVYHGCGHDGHSSILAGTILATEGIKLNKNVIFLFQAAEENGSGAKLTDELFKKYKIDKIYGLHNMPMLEKNVVGYKKGTMMCASCGYTFKITGKQSHASLPENAKNPAFVISKVIEMLEPLSKFNGFKAITFENHDFKDLIMATIINVKIGEKNFGISPANGEISMTLRSAKEDELNILFTMIYNKIKELCGSEYIFSYEEFDAFPETNNDDELTEETIKIFKEKGFKVIENKEPFRASEDFGYYKKFAPSLFFFLGNGDSAPLHDDMYKFNDDILETGIALFKTIIESENN